MLSEPSLGKSSLACAMPSQSPHISLHVVPQAKRKHQREVHLINPWAQAFNVCILFLFYVGWHGSNTRDCQDASNFLRPQAMHVCPACSATSQSTKEMKVISSIPVGWLPQTQGIVKMLGSSWGLKPCISATSQSTKEIKAINPRAQAFNICTWFLCTM